MEKGRRLRRFFVGSDHDQAAAGGARHRMDGVDRPKLEARRFNVNPQGMFRDAERLRHLCPAITHRQKGKPVNLAWRQRLNLAGVAIRLEIKRFLVEVMRDQYQVAPVVFCKGGPGPIIAIMADGKKRKLAIWPAHRH